MSAIWYRDLAAAFRLPHALRFVPQKDMSTREQLNSVFRLAVYFSVIMVGLTRKASYALVALGVGLVTALVNESSGAAAREAGEDFRVRACTPPTPNNPYMNFVHTVDAPLRAPACQSWTFPTRGDAPRKGGAPKHLRPRDDWEFDRFYTMPSTTGVSDQRQFANFLYDEMPAKS